MTDQIITMSDGKAIVGELYPDITPDVALGLVRGLLSPNSQDGAPKATISGELFYLTGSSYAARVPGGEHGAIEIDLTRASRYEDPDWDGVTDYTVSISLAPGAFDVVEWRSDGE